MFIVCNFFSVVFFSTKNLCALLRWRQTKIIIIKKTIKDHKKKNLLLHYFLFLECWPHIYRDTNSLLFRKLQKKDKVQIFVILAYVISSVLKLDTMELIKFSRMITARIDFQSDAFSPSSKHIDSSANFTTAGGFAIERTSTRCCFLMDFTARKSYLFLSY